MIMKTTSHDVLFSVIVPVYNVEGFLRQCLDSLVQQTLQSIEIIIVNDKSPDHSCRIIDEYQRQFSNIVTINLPANVGLGNARNAGIKVAVGKYISFVDSDDWVGKHMFESLHSMIVADSPDIVMFNYVREFIDGKTSINESTYLLKREKDTPQEQHNKKQLLFSFNVAWNKVYKRTFLEKLHMEFGKGYYEDISWTFPLLIKASTIKVTDEVLYHYRQRQTSILNTRSSHHLEVFEQYERLFYLIKNDNIDDETQIILCNRMVNHYIAIMTTQKNRIPENEMRNFCKNFHDHLDTFAGKFSHEDILVSAPRKQEIQINEQFNPKKLFFLALIKKNRYLTYKLFSKLSSAVNKTRGFITGKKHFVHLSKRYLYEKLYLLFLFLPVDPKLALFSSYWGEQFSCNPKWISLALQEIDGSYTCAWESTNDFDLPTSMEHVRKYSLKYYYYCARGKYFVNNVNFPDFIKKRKNTVFIQTQHGTPLKIMGFDFMKKSSIDRTDPAGLILRSMRWDYILSSNSYSSEIWKGAFPFDYKVLEFGYPRNDILFHHNEKDIERIKADIGIGSKKKVLFYAPTHKEYEKETSIHFDIKKLCKEIGGEFVILIRAHHLKSSISHTVSEELTDCIKDVTDYPEVQELNLISDVLLTDYSSIMFDYACLNRPIILFLDDYEIYSAVRGMYYNIVKDSPGPVVTNTDELISMLKENQYSSKKNLSRLNKFRSIFCDFDKGDAGKQLIENVFINR